MFSAHAPIHNPSSLLLCSKKRLIRMRNAVAAETRNATATQIKSEQSFGTPFDYVRCVSHSRHSTSQILIAIRFISRLWFDFDIQFRAEHFRLTAEAHAFNVRSRAIDWSPHVVGLVESENTPDIDQSRRSALLDGDAANYRSFPISQMIARKIKL